MGRFEKRDRDDSTALVIRGRYSKLLFMGLVFMGVFKLGEIAILGVMALIGY